MSERIYTALGMMSGTSMDGIDISLIRTDGQGHVDIVSGGNLFVPYDDRVKKEVRSVLGHTDMNAGEMRDAAEAVTGAYMWALDQYWHKSGFTPHDIDVIGAHGQTVSHMPDEGLTIQLGDAQKLSDYAGVPVIFDLRRNDVANGGQGAPLLPVYHMALMAEKAPSFPAAVLNLGGVGNITYIPAAGEASRMQAFDTGPANAYMDDWVNYKLGLHMDKNGDLARQGYIHTDIVEKFMRSPYFAAKPPKSLDRNEFTFLLEDVVNLSVEDGAATLLECTVQSIVRSFAFFDEAPAHLYVCGGGVHNIYLMERLQDVLIQKDYDCRIDSLQTLGIETDYIEAQGFAYMAVRSLIGLPITFPGTTGVPQALTGGKLYTPATMSVDDLRDKIVSAHG